MLLFIMNKCTQILQENKIALNYQHSGEDFPLSSLTMTTSCGQVCLQVLWAKLEGSPMGGWQGWREWLELPLIWLPGETSTSTSTIPDPST